jgi:hypothetical protein
MGITVASEPIPPGVPSISAYIDHSLTIGDTNFATITVHCFNDAAAPNEHTGFPTYINFGA